MNSNQNESAAWLHPAIDELMKTTGTKWEHLSAVAVSAGPGSYTGLRVGVAGAKGICYSLNIPLLCINSLKVMAAAAKHQTNNLLCPMIDARRMEVFTAVYDQHLQEQMPPVNLILDENSFADILSQQVVAFFGNGSDKFRRIIKSEHAVFIDVETTAEQMITLAHEKLNRKDFDDLAYAEPFYIKDFYSTMTKINGH